MQGVGHNVQIQDYVFVILKPIQTKISVCFDPIIYPPGSHQLAGRLVCLQLHMDSWCVPSGVATWAIKGGKGAFNSVLLKHRVSHLRNIPWHHTMYSFHLNTSSLLNSVTKFLRTLPCMDILYIYSYPRSSAWQGELALSSIQRRVCQVLQQMAGSVILQLVLQV